MQSLFNKKLFDLSIFLNMIITATLLVLMILPTLAYAEKSRFNYWASAARSNLPSSAGQLNQSDHLYLGFEYRLGGRVYFSVPLKESGMKWPLGLCLRPIDISMKPFQVLNGA